MNAPVVKKIEPERFPTGSLSPCKVKLKREACSPAGLRLYPSTKSRDSGLGCPEWSMVKNSKIEEQY